MGINNNQIDDISESFQEIMNDDLEAINNDLSPIGLSSFDSDSTNDNDMIDIDDLNFDDDRIDDDMMNNQYDNSDNNTIESNDNNTVLRDTATLPSWVQDIRRLFDTSTTHSFLLDGNIHDYLTRSVKLVDGIVYAFDNFGKFFDGILVWNVADGLMIYNNELADWYDTDTFNKNIKESIKKIVDHDVDDDFIHNLSSVELFDILSKIFNNDNKRYLLFIQYPEFLVPVKLVETDSKVQSILTNLIQMTTSELARVNGSCIFFISDNVSRVAHGLIHSSSDTHSVHVPLPLYDDRKDFIDNVLLDDESYTENGSPLCINPDDPKYANIDLTNYMTSDIFALNTAGLTRYQIEYIYNIAKAKDIPVTLALIREERGNVIMQDFKGLLQVLDTKNGFDDLGGLQHIKDFFMHEVITPIKTGNTETVPMGVMLMGPPGSSKALNPYTLIPVYDKRKYVYIKDLVPGDIVFDGFTGNPSKVIGVHVKGKETQYKITLKDNTSIICSLDHLFLIKTYKMHKTKSDNWKCFSLKDIINKPLKQNGAYQFFLPIAPPIIKGSDFNKVLSIIQQYMKMYGFYRGTSLFIKPESNDNRTILTLKEIQELFNQIGIRIIPKKNNIFKICAKNKIKQKIINNCEWKNNYNDLLQEQEKNKKYNSRLCIDDIPIIKIEKLPEQSNMICITVDNPSGSYIATKNSIVTHNTALSKAVAYESKMNCVSMDLSVILSGEVDMAEHELTRAFDAAIAMEPTIIFIDEIDEALPKRHTGQVSGTVQRITQKILSFFSDTSHRGQVIILAATNYPEQVDSAIKRIGRFDVRIPVFAPDKFDRIKIINIMAKRKNYTLSCLDDPDMFIENPFKNMQAFIEAGLLPNYQGFTGEQVIYTFNNGSYESSIYIPEVIQRVLDQETITLQDFYTAASIALSERLPGRYKDSTTAEVESENVFFKRIHDTIYNSQDLFGTDTYNLDTVVYRLQIYEKIWRPFMEKTEYMTGAELERVMAKAITISQDEQAENPELYNKLLESGILTSERDISYKSLYKASTKIISQTSGVKRMEDYALIDTTDKDFVPDAKYGITNDGREISYAERQHQLLIAARTVNS